jgi:dGTP triphosphohydrolase/REP element-mobilizing transposase RayT
MEATERATLAPFAQKSGESRGRKYAEPSHAYRTEFQRDRARIIHSRAFRRLEYKTQVFLNGTGDHLRTRLTHSIEVASISRTIARALSINEDLAEAIALAHDLGHTPFGHSGEEILAECMRDHGGFEHNRQSLRVVELLENPYPAFPGLNLTFEVREGLRKHEPFYDDKAQSDNVAQASRLRLDEECEPEARPALDTFRGFDEFAEVDVTRRRLPHWRQEGVTYFVTFRLADSIPADKLVYLEEERSRWLQSHPEPWTEQQKRDYYERFTVPIERWLDAGYGSCVLRDERASKTVADALQHFDGDRYILGAWVVMPNHVHVLVTPKGSQTLADILHSWKSFTAHEINRQLNRSGQLWQHESYDHMVRNDPSRFRISQYIERNPEFAGLKVAQASRLRTGEERKPEARATLGYNYPALEAQVADIADEITYYSHDLDDAVDFQILSTDQLETNEVWQSSQRAVLTRYPDAREPELHKLVIRDIIDLEVQDVIATSARATADSGVRSADEVRKQPEPLVRYSKRLGEANRALREFLYANVYYHPRVAEVNRRAGAMLRKVFQSYVSDPTQLGTGALKRIEQEGLHRTVCDYVAGMTDRYLMEEYARLTA